VTTDGATSTQTSQQSTLLLIGGDNSLGTYLPILKAQGIVYAESVSGFEKGYYVGLGMAEGAVGPFLVGVKKALKSEKKEKKRTKYMDKENKVNRDESSVEI
jgi:hypothetical protein